MIEEKIEEKEEVNFLTMNIVSKVLGIDVSEDGLSMIGQDIHYFNNDNKAFEKIGVDAFCERIEEIFIVNFYSINMEEYTFQKPAYNYMVTKDFEEKYVYIIRDCENKLQGMIKSLNWLLENNNNLTFSSPAYVYVFPFEKE